MATPTIINKITSKTIGLDLDVIKTTEAPLYRIVGIAIGLKKGIGNYGDWEKLVGQFEAYVFATGKSYISNEAFLPSVANGLIAAQISGENSVEFAFEVGGKPTGKSDGSGQGYEFTVKSLIESSEASPLDALKSAANFTSAPELEAPKKVAGKK